MCIIPTPESVAGAAQAAQHLDQLDALFERLLLRCPRVLATGTAADQFALLRLLRGVVLGGARLRLVLASGAVMQRLCTVLLFMVELRSGDGLAVEALRESRQLLALQPSATGDVDDVRTAAADDTPVWREYRHLGTRAVRLAAEELCAVIGRSAGGEAVFAQLLLRLRDRTAGSNEALLVMRLMVAGEGWAEVERCRALMAELVSGTEHWELDVQPLGRVDVRHEREQVSVAVRRVCVEPTTDVI